MHGVTIHMQRAFARPTVLGYPASRRTVAAMASSTDSTHKIQLPNTMEAYHVSSDQRVFAPAAGRNKDPICEVLTRHLGKDTQTLLELACGTGEHTAHLAAALPSTSFQPTDLTSELFQSVAAHAIGLSNVRAPKLLDASDPSSWEAALTDQPPVDAILCINMTHISPYKSTLGLLDGASRFLKAGTGLLFVYGPFTIDGGKHTSESNREFDASLRQRNPEWGYRDIEAVKAQAGARGLVAVDVVSMPANNFFLIFQKA